MEISGYVHINSLIIPLYIWLTVSNYEMANFLLISGNSCRMHRRLKDYTATVRYLETLYIHHQEKPFTKSISFFISILSKDSDSSLPSLEIE